ncbi:hypothetical protein PR202_ga08836 [Eleusine coracana subsp. coracana]|uniref:Probable magnesium transporter n=1 Tax=Eleusine coracana subsp. coracana TaxID=191504 RepID=A0AAV5C3M5_ELECO|nr:hypothetical protein PR202_ga08836 [Eleusine coracana subsp. coracana]
MAAEVSTSAAAGHGSWVDGMSADNIKGLVLALSSSFFIGASFIVKKKGLKKAGASGVRAGDLISFLRFPMIEALRCFVVAGLSVVALLLWLSERVDDGVNVDLIRVIVGEVANFAAYAFAPAILVTPLGALSIIISAALADIMLKEKLHIFGILGCVLCVVGSTTIVLHAPQERDIESVAEVWDLATEPAFLFYAAIVLVATLLLIYYVIPKYGQTHIMVYIGVCSLVGSLSVMSVKALGIALKLTFSGMNQLIYPQTWLFTIVVVACIVTQMNYLNKVIVIFYIESSQLCLVSSVYVIEKSEMQCLLISNFQALDTFNTAVVSPIYYTMFTSLTILASVIMFKAPCSHCSIIHFLLEDFISIKINLCTCTQDWDRQNPTQIVTEMCGFVTILSGTFLLHKTKDMVDGLPPTLPIRIPKHGEEDDYGGEGIPLRSAAEGIPLKSPRAAESFRSN